MNISRRLAVLCVFLCFSAPLGAKELRDLGSAPQFSLFDQTGREISSDELIGKAWLADFIFTRCAQCAGVSSKLSELSAFLPEEVAFVSFSLDPSFDSSAILAAYEDAYNTGGREWYFLTGSETAIHGITREGFHLAVERNEDAAGPAEAIIHSLRLVLVDQSGVIKAYFDTEDPVEMKSIRSAVLKVLHPPFVMSLPRMNAILNIVCACLLVNGYFLVRRRNIRLHKTCMLAAFSVSALFLASYLYYHFQVGSVRFQSQGTLRTAYFAILISHTILAAVNVPLILITIFLGLTGRFAKHRKFARVTFPSWLYVSVTGVLVYWLLYHVDV